MNLGRIPNNENVFKGSLLVSTLLERYSKQFRSRTAAVKFARRLFRDGIIRSVFGADTFEDSVQFYTWNDKEGLTMSSSFSPPTAGRQQYSHFEKVSGRRENAYDQSMVDDVRNKILRREGNSSSVNSFFKQIEEDFPEDTSGRAGHSKQFPSYQTSWNLQRASTASSESSVDILGPAYSRAKERGATKVSFPPPVSSRRDHDVIPEESQEEPAMDGPVANSVDYDGTSSISRSVATTVSSALNDVDDHTPRRWQESQNSYSDNEKQLIEQMKRMKKEHQYILRTYEDRINKLMAKMHELRSIAEMLENSSTKSSPYGISPMKAGILNFIGSKMEYERKQSAAQIQDPDVPPPLPPRPGRGGSHLYPSKPIIHTRAKMRPLSWTRVILTDNDTEGVRSTIWHTMTEPKLDYEEIERLFSTPDGSQTDGATLYDDLVIRRGNYRQKLVGIFEGEKSKRIIHCMRCLRATLTDVIGTVSSLDTSQINHDSLAELIEHVASGTEIETVLLHVRKKGAGQLDHPEYLVFELSKVDHFRDRLEFIRFRYRLQWHLFEIEQQLRELHTACDELSNSTPLKHLLETLLTIGNYLNGGTERGQADGFGLDILNKIKDIQDRDAKGNLLEFVLKIYCQLYENEAEIGCPTRFRLPEPSNMRHAAQVSFEGVQDALSNLYSDLRGVREKLLDPKVNKDTTRPTDSFRVTAENFFAAALEVIGEQEKVLQDTRDHFEKTISYFVLEANEVTMQDFFQIWALFLHDCKYFWKLAHRRLAKERFELEFKYKGQLSAVSLHGYGSFRADINRVKTTHPVTSESRDPVENSKLKHIDNWMQSLENVTELEKTPVSLKPSRECHNPRETEENRAIVSDLCYRSASPKPLTSTPPTSSDVHKPTPKSPVVVASNFGFQTSSTLSSVGVQPIPFSDTTPNYENQSQYDRLARNYSKEMPPKLESKQLKSQMSSAEIASSQKKSQQFSLKSWLKRERESVRREVEGTGNNIQEINKTTSPSKSFAKFRNSVVQRFTGSSGVKRNQDKMDSPDSKLSTDNSKFSLDTQPALKFDRYGRLETESQNDCNVDSYQRERLISRPEQIPVECNAGTDHTYPVNSNTFLKTPWTNDIMLSPEKRAAGVNIVSPMNDVNNNNKQYDSRIRSDVLHALQTPIKATTDIYRHGHSDSENSSPQRDNTSVSANAALDSKRFQANPVPTYKAKVINTYENQGKFDPLYAPRQQAQSVVYGDAIRDKKGGTANKNEDPYNKENSIVDPYHHGTPQKGLPLSSSSSVYTATPYRRYDDRQHNQGGSSQSASQQSTPQQAARETSNDNQRYFTPGNRAPINVRSITSLIDKFECHKGSDETHNAPKMSHDNSPPPLPVKPIIITSTPVGHKKEIQTGNDNEVDESPPLPPRSDLNANRYVFSPVKNSSNIGNNPSPGNNNNNNTYVNNDNTHYFPHSRRSIDNYGFAENKNPGLSQVTNNGLSNVENYRSSDTFNNRSHAFQPTTDRPSNYQTPNKIPSYSSRGNYIMPSTDKNDLCHSRNDTDNTDDVYSVQLRRAANTSVFDRHQKTSPSYQSRPPASAAYTSPEPTAIVKPTVVHQGPVSYMEI
ncbi:hypothetical protein CHS0354_034773 [Potamilus streckersoni]|nr:hypothetical protein CHS0354_034773 [Potamilus streckersoni]